MRFLRRTARISEQVLTNLAALVLANEISVSTPPRQRGRGGTQRDKNPQVKPPKNYSHSVVAKPNFLIPRVAQSLWLLIVITFVANNHI